MWSKLKCSCLLPWMLDLLVEWLLTGLIGKNFIAPEPWCMNILTNFMSDVDLCWCLSSDSSKAKKSYLVLTCGAPSINTSLPKAKGQDGQMCSSDEDDDESNDDQTVSSLLTRQFSGLYILHLFTALNLYTLSALVHDVFLVLSFFTSKVLNS